MHLHQPAWKPVVVDPVARLVRFDIQDRLPVEELEIGYDHAPRLVDSQEANEAQFDGVGAGRQIQ